MSPSFLPAFVHKRTLSTQLHVLYSTYLVFVSQVVMYCHDKQRQEENECVLAYCLYVIPCLGLRAKFLTPNNNQERQGESEREREKQQNLLLCSLCPSRRNDNNEFYVPQKLVTLPWLLLSFHYWTCTYIHSVHEGYNMKRQSWYSLLCRLASYSARSFTVLQP